MSTKQCCRNRLSGACNAFRQDGIVKVGLPEVERRPDTIAADSSLVVLASLHQAARLIVQRKRHCNSKDFQRSHQMTGYDYIGAMITIGTYWGCKRCCAGPRQPSEKQMLVSSAH